MEGWDGLCFSKSKLRAWNLLFYALIWIIWEFRNNVVFNGRSICASTAIDSVKFRVVWWFKNFGLGSKEDITVLLY